MPLVTFYTGENNKKCQEVEKETNGMKWVKDAPCFNPL